MQVCRPSPLQTGSWAVVGIAELVVGLLLPSMCTCLLLAFSRQGQPGLGVPAVLGPHGVWRMGGQEDLVPSFSAVFGKAEHAQAPCTGVSGLCRRLVACVALGRDTLLGKLCPCAPGQSPALAHLWGGRAGHRAQPCHVLSTSGQARGRVLLPGRDEYWGGYSWHLSRGI